MIRFSTKAIASAAAGVTLAGAGVTAALAYGGTSEAASAPRTQSAAAKTTQQAPAQAEKRAVEAGKDQMFLAVKKAKEPKKEVKKAVKKADKAPALPTGVSTATSFWDPSTASGKPMAYETIASPYWPLGTKVKVTYKGKSEIGIVQDFGPAEWAVAQHNPPALIDLSEKMMKHLTGTASNSITVNFQVLELGKGPVYRHEGTGYLTATGTAKAAGKE